MRKPVLERTLGYSTGAAGTPIHGYSRWRYQKSSYPVRVFRVFRGRQRLESNGRLTEFGRRSSGHDFPERLRRLGITVVVDRDVAIVRDADVTVAQPL